jgi:deazaflavin-dependent oxidoreductase (nitroreductase family)
VKFWLFNHVFNPIVKAVLRSPFHRVLSPSLAVLTYTGSRTGRPRSLPVMYVEDRGSLFVFAGRPREKRWWRNLRGGAPVELVLRGDHFEGRAEVLSEDGATDAEAVALYAAKFPRAGAHLEAGENAVLVRIELTSDGSKEGT